MTLKEPTRPIDLAFRRARKLAEESAVASHEQSPIDMGEYDAGNAHEEAIGRVRRVLVDGYRQVSQATTDDYDGDRFLEEHCQSQDDRDEFLFQLSHREESGYLYGLAVGILLGRGGVR